MQLNKPLSRLKAETAAPIGVVDHLADSGLRHAYRLCDFALSHAAGKDIEKDLFPVHGSILAP